MIIELLRIISLILLIVVIIIDINIPIILHTQINQLIIAIIIIIILLIVDEILGFLLGLIYLVVYFKYYQRKINNQSLKEPLIINDKTETDIKPMINQRTPIITEHYTKNNNGCIEMSYISNELLEKAQNNIYDVNNYNTNNEIQGFINENIIQGFDKNSIDNIYSKL